MKSYKIELSSEQVIALFEMCEHCSSVVHSKYPELGDEPVPKSFNLIMSIQDKLDGCEEMNNKVSLLELAERDCGKTWLLQELRK